MNPTASSASARSKLPLALWFVVVAGLIWAEQSLPHWSGSQWRAGSHADGPFHFSCELSRLQPGAFLNDLAVQSNQSLGAYETSYRGAAGLAQATGWSLLATNLVLCWLGNFYYLAGVMFLLCRLKLRSVWCALGTVLAAQPFVLIGMSSGVVHSLLIPREFWLGPLPWLVAWFVLGRRESWRLLGFYAMLGAIYGLTYPLWAVLFGLAFGLADAWRLWRGKRYADFVWLAGGGFLCAVIIALPALAIARTMAGGESAVLDYNQITRSVYWTKGFRRLVIFAALGWVALRFLRQQPAAPTEVVLRLGALLGASLGVCLVYEPFQRLLPTLSLLYLGRLSLVAYLVSALAVAGWLHYGWPSWQCRGRALAVLGLVVFFLDPVKHVIRDRREHAPPFQPDFVRICRAAKQAMSADRLALVPPDAGCHYFRVYAERGLWINPKDTGVLSRTRALYSEAKQRLQLYDAFYAADTPLDRRENLLQQFRTNGVTHVVTQTNDAWAASLSWPVVRSEGRWQLRTEAQAP